MKYLIAGLGNVGPDYEGTRHNIGFEIVDHLAKEFEAEWKDDRLGYTTSIKFKGRTIHLLKPNTFMNRSGKSVFHWINKLNIKDSNFLVIVDDLNLDFGILRLRAKGKDGGHNGLKDINNYFRTEKYARLRVGIGSDFSRGQQVDYVLGKWRDEEISKLPIIINRSAEAVKDFCTIGIKFAMEKANQKK